LDNTGHQHEVFRMRKFISAHAKNHFGELIDAARAVPVAITKYDRTVVVIVAAEEFERLTERKMKRSPRGLSKRRGSDLS
jgi:prevent-host-death family protein